MRTSDYTKQAKNFQIKKPRNTSFTRPTQIVHYLGDDYFTKLFSPKGDINNISKFHLEQTRKY